MIRAKTALLACAIGTVAIAAGAISEIATRSSSREVTGARARIVTDPAASFREFCSGFVAALEGSIFERYEDGELHRYRERALKGQYRIDVRRTDSLISPFIGTLEMIPESSKDGSPFIDLAKRRYTFAAQDGKWILSSLESNYDMGNNVHWVNAADDALRRRMKIAADIQKS